MNLKGNYYIDHKNGERTDKKLIENILLTIKQPVKEIQASEFQNQFTLKSINDFFTKEADNYWITNEYQKEFIIEELTNPDKLKRNLISYFQNYDHSGYIDGSSTKVKIDFHFADSIISISTKSILYVGLPFEINGEKNYSPKLANLLGELVPASKTKRKEQFEGKDLFSAVIEKTIVNHRKEIDNLESKSYQVYIDSLKNKFTVTNTRVSNGTLSTNWNGEKRLNCTLTHSSMVPNVSIDYSTTIVEGKIQYPVALIMDDYARIYSSVMGSSFFKDYLAENENRHLTIIYDDYRCFTQKAVEFAISDCDYIKTVGNFDYAVFISLKNEFGNISRWGLLPNGEYFTWWNNGNPPIPQDDKHYVRCQ